MVEYELPKLDTWVRFPSPAKIGSALLVLASLLIAGTAGAELSFSVSFDRQFYHLGRNASVPIVCRIENTGRDRERIYPGAVPWLNLRFSVRSLTGREVLLDEGFALRARRTAPRYDREFVLQPGESYELSADLAEWFQLRDAGTYAVTGTYFPEQTARSNRRVESGRAEFHLRPPPSVARAMEELRRREKEEEARKLTPYEVVAAALRERIRRRWDRYLFHFDLKSMVRERTVLADAAVTPGTNLLQLMEHGTAEQEEQALERARELVIEECNDFEIRSFSVQSSYVSNQAAAGQDSRFAARVVVNADIAERRGLRFVFYLRKLGDYWKITSYQSDVSR